MQEGAENIVTLQKHLINLTQQQQILTCRNLKGTSGR